MSNKTIGMYTQLLRNFTKNPNVNLMVSPWQQRRRGGGGWGVTKVIRTHSLDALNFSAKFLLTIHPAVEIFQSRIKWWTDRGIN